MFSLSLGFVSIGSIFTIFLSLFSISIVQAADLSAQSDETVFFRGWQYRTDIVQSNIDRYNDEMNGNVDYQTLTGDYPAIMEQNLMSCGDLDIFYANPSQASRYYDGGWVKPANTLPNFDEIIRDRIFGEFIIDHLYYFTEKTLRCVCEASGFDVIRIEEIWNGASLSAVVQKRKPLTAVPFKENQVELIQDMDDFINKHESATIWGAGHQTLMFLTMMNSLDKVPFIIDDFKPWIFVELPLGEFLSLFGF